MKHNQENIELRLKSLIEQSESQQTGTCNSIIWKILSLLGFIAVAGCLAALIYTWFQWESNSNNYELAKEDLARYEKELAQALTEQKGLKTNYDDLEKQYNDAKNNNDALKKKIEEAKSKKDTDAKKLEEVKGQIVTMKSERDHEKTTNEQLKQVEQQLNKELSEIQKTIDALRANLTVAEKKLHEWQIFSGLGLTATIAGGLFDAYRHHTLAPLKMQANRATHSAAGFPNVATSFENYVYLKQLDKKAILHQPCFTNGKKDDLAKCEGNHPLVITISTYSGYYFSIYLSIPFSAAEKSYNDENSFIISGNNGMIAKIKSPLNALTINKNHLLEFGDGGIVIALDGKSGTADARAYDVPSPHNAITFLTGGSGTFEIEEIKISKFDVVNTA